MRNAFCGLLLAAAALAGCADVGIPLRSECTQRIYRDTTEWRCVRHDRKGRCREERLVDTVKVECVERRCVEPYTHGTGEPPRHWGRPACLTREEAAERRGL